MNAADAHHPRRGPLRRLRRRGDPEERQFRGSSRRGVRHPRRLRLRQEHAAEAHDRAQRSHLRPRLHRRRRHRHRRRRAAQRDPAPLRRDVPVGRAVRVDDAAGERPAAAGGVHRPAGRRDRPDRADEARAGRARGLHRPSPGRALRRHAEARRHRPRDGARSRDPVHGRALVRPRPHHRGVARRDDPPAVREPRRHLRHRHPRPRQHLRGHRPRDPARPQGAGHHRAGRSAEAARRDGATPACAPSSAAKPRRRPPDPNRPRTARR